MDAAMLAMELQGAIITTAEWKLNMRQPEIPALFSLD